MGIFNWSQNKKVKDFIAHFVAQANSLPVEQVKSSLVERIFDALDKEKRENIVKQIDKHGEEAVVSKFRQQFEQALR